MTATTALLHLGRVNGCGLRHLQRRRPMEGGAEKSEHWARSCPALTHLYRIAAPRTSTKGKPGPSAAPTQLSATPKNGRNTEMRSKKRRSSWSPIPEQRTYGAAAPLKVLQSFLGEQRKSWPASRSCRARLAENTVPATTNPTKQTTIETTWERISATSGRIPTCPHTK